MNYQYKIVSIAETMQGIKAGSMASFVAIESKELPIFVRTNNSDQWDREISVLHEDELSSAIINGFASITFINSDGEFKFSNPIANPCIVDVYSFINTKDSSESSVLESIKIIDDIDDFCEKLHIDYPDNLPLGSKFLWVEMGS